MESTNIMQDFEALPPEAQRQVTDFIAFLKTRYVMSRQTKKKRRPLSDEPFIGMWRDREDMKDGAEWVRRLRRSEWGDPS
jgi:hypothetical protein